MTMAKPYVHAIASASKYGGKPEDYQDIHDFMDSSKSVISDVRHRAIFHHSFGTFVVEKLFGVTRVNSDGNTYSPRDVAEQHVIEDLGYLPTVQDYFDDGEFKVAEWMGGKSLVGVSEPISESAGEIPKESGGRRFPVPRDPMNDPFDIIKKISID